MVGTAGVLALAQQIVQDVEVQWPRDGQASTPGSTEKHKKGKQRERIKWKAKRGRK